MENLKRCIIGAKYTDEIKELESLGFECITFRENKNLDDEINSHTDLNCFKLTDKILLADSVTAGELSQKLNDYKFVAVNGIKSPYPNDVKLNAAILGNKVICNSKYTTSSIIEFQLSNNLRLINTKQGYTKCNLCVVSDNAIITEDDGLACLLKNYQIDVLKIEPGFVHLSDKHYGFIGGASGKVTDNEIYFSGNISEHPNYKEIEEFLNKYNTKPIFNKNRKISDFGGFIVL